MEPCDLRLDPLIPLMQAATRHAQSEEPDCTDADEDGLCDCNTDDKGAVFTSMTMATDSTIAKKSLSAQARAADTDVDGIPDPVEHRFQTDAVRRDDIGDSIGISPQMVWSCAQAVTRSAMMRMAVAALPTIIRFENSRWAARQPATVCAACHLTPNS